MKFKVRLVIAGRVAIIDLSAGSDAERVLILKAFEELLPIIERVHAAAEAINCGIRSHGVEVISVEGREVHCVKGLATELEVLKSAISDLSAGVKDKAVPGVNLFELCMDLAWAFRTRIT
jgi:hypothetical protein